MLDGLFSGNEGEKAVRETVKSAMFSGSATLSSVPVSNAFYRRKSDTVFAVRITDPITIRYDLANIDGKAGDWLLIHMNGMFEVVGDDEFLMAFELVR